MNTEKRFDEYAPLVSSPAYWKIVELCDSLGFPYVLTLLAELAGAAGIPTLATRLKADAQHARKIYEKSEKPLDSPSTIG